MDVIQVYDVMLHTPIVLILCALGSLGHLMSIGVLWRMPNPTNVLLLSMSGSQLVLCVNFLYSTLFKYSSDMLCFRSLWSSYWWTLSLLISVNLSVLVHLFSTFHLVALAIIRHLSLRQLAQMDSPSSWFTYRKSMICLLFIYTSAIIVCTPLYFQSEVVNAVPPDNCDATLQSQAQSGATAQPQPTAYRLAFSDNTLLQSLNFWLFGSVCKLVPCSIIGLMTLGILRNLRRIQAMSFRFKHEDRNKQHHRTTNIILTVMLMFIVVEFPQGLIAVAQSLYQIPYLHTIGDMFEVLTLLNSCLIFALFCSMNSRVRLAFAEKSRILSQRLHLLHNEKLYSKRLRWKWRNPKGTSNVKSHQEESLVTPASTRVRRISSLPEKEHYLLKEIGSAESTSGIEQDGETVHV